MNKVEQRHKDSQAIVKGGKSRDEFARLRILALELKNLQLQILKDLNKKETTK